MNKNHHPLSTHINEYLHNIQCYHLFTRGDRRIVIDVPFELKMSPDREKFYVVIYEDQLPRQFKPDDFEMEQSKLAQALGCSVEVARENGKIVLGLKPSEVKLPLAV